MQYEAAFQRERKARKSAESILEQKSRELHLSNQALQENIDSLQFALRENKFLNHIGRYGLERPRLRDFLPTVVIDMMRLSDIPYAAFVHFPFDDPKGRYHSPLMINPDLENRELDTTNLSDVKDLMNEVEPLIRERGVTHLQIIELTIDQHQLDTLIALPIISLNTLCGIVFLFSDGITDKQNQVFNLFKTGFKQLAIILEHRYQEDKLLASYEELSQANQALQDTQMKLLQSEKMATVGQLSAGIAHEINNPMGFIKSNMRTLGDYIDDFINYAQTSRTLIDTSTHAEDNHIQEAAAQLDTLWKKIDMNYLMEDSHTLISESQQGIKRIIDIVGGLKRFSRQSDNQKELSDLGQIINEALKLASNELKFKGEVTKHLANVPPVLGNYGELLQVFLNMFVNASHAMNEHGKLTIELTDHQQGARVAIRDNGCGIDEENLKSIFNPFFTTKDVGVGTGLGLSISYGIIQDHQGTIEVESEVGKGTTFYIWLPYKNQQTKNSKEENNE